MIYLECNPDELLCKKLGIPKKFTKHHNDKGRIVRYLIRQNHHLGLVDEDPGAGKPSAMDKFKEEEAIKFGIRQYIDLNKNKLIVVCPRLEGWLIDVCKKNKVDIAKFNLPVNEEKLHNEINSKLKELDKLLSHLLAIKSPELLYLKSLLSNK